MQIFGGVNASLSSRAGNSDPSESYLGPISYQPEELLRGGNTDSPYDPRPSSRALTVCFERVSTTGRFQDFRLRLGIINPERLGVRVGSLVTIASVLRSLATSTNALIQLESEILWFGIRGLSELHDQVIWVPFR